MNPCEVTASVTALANLIAARLSQAELGALAAILTQLGDTLATIVAVGESCGAQLCGGEQSGCIQK